MTYIKSFVVVLLSLSFFGAVHAEKQLVEPVFQGGIYSQEWFHESFMELAEDVVEASDENKRFVLMFEQKSCIYCKRIHTEVLAEPGINKFVKDRFNVLQINLFGDREVTDFDGEVLTEKELAVKWGVMFTPTIVFMPDPLTEGLDERPGYQQAVAQMPGAFGKGTFTALFDWVYDKGYSKDEHFQKFVARRAAELKSEGVF
ncbi:MAG: thioredoxin family protein [Alphaproteobacteria bacterium]